MEITKIEKQKKDKHRYNIFVDGEFRLGIHEDVLVKFGLRAGDKTDEVKINELRDKDEITNGKKIAYSFLAYRQRSKSEIEKRLKQKKISAKNIEKIISILEEQKYLNDKMFAKNYLEEKITNKPAGKRLMKLKLLEKGIDKETADTTLEDYYSDEKEIELAQKLLEKYSKKIRSKDMVEKKYKCYRYLVSRGFGSDIINSVLKTND